MEFMGNSSALLQTHVFLPDLLFLLFSRLNFRCARVPSSGTPLFDQRVVSEQEHR